MGSSVAFPKTAIAIHKTDLRVPLEADIAARPYVNQEQRALAETVEQAAREYISGALKTLAHERDRGPSRMQPNR